MSLLLPVGEVDTLLCLKLGEIAIIEDNAVVPVGGKLSELVEGRNKEGVGKKRDRETGFASVGRAVEIEVVPLGWNLNIPSGIWVSVDDIRDNTSTVSEKDGDIGDCFDGDSKIVDCFGDCMTLSDGFGD